MLKRCTNASTSADRSGKRKIQCHSWEMAALQLAIWAHDENVIAIRRFIRACFVPGGALDPPLHIIAKGLDKLKDLSIVAKKDIAIQGRQCYQAVAWGIINNFLKGNIDYITCEWKKDSLYICKPAVLDVVTERIHMCNHEKQ